MTETRLLYGDFVNELLKDSGIAKSFLEGSAEEKSRRAEGFRVRESFR